MYLRKAEALASRGLLAGSDKFRVEERLGMRLPGPRPTVWAGAAPKEDDVTKRDGGEQDPVPQPEPEPQPEPTPEPEPEPQEATVEESVEAISQSVGRLADAEISDEQRGVLAAAARSLDALLGDEGLSARAARQFQTRDAAVQEALGEGVELNAATIRDLTTRARVGDELKSELIDETVRQRVRVMGEGFNADSYRRVLSAMDVTTIKEEKASWQAATPFRAGRQVEPGSPPDLPQTRITRQAPDAPAASDQEPILSRRDRK
jgi:hypothetical protein